MFFLAVLTFVLSLAFSLAIIVPLTGILVRFRANYNPKGLQLDAEGVVQPPHTGPIVSFLGMFKRVYMLEVRSYHFWLKCCSRLMHRDGLDCTRVSVSDIHGWDVSDHEILNHDYIVPTFLSTMVIIIVMLLTLGSLRSRHGLYNPPDTGVLGTLFYAIFMMLISLPVYIITYR